jgi:hypothetical protein
MSGYKFVLVSCWPGLNPRSSADDKPFVFHRIQSWSLEGLRLQNLETLNFLFWAREWLCGLLIENKTLVLALEIEMVCCDHDFHFIICFFIQFNHYQFIYDGYNGWRVDLIKINNLFCYYFEMIKDEDNEKVEKNKVNWFFY